MLELPKGKGKKRIESLGRFAIKLIEIYKRIGFKISARGWCYQLEGFGLITKDQFNRVEKVIDQCRKYGILPVDFVAEDDARTFSGVETPTESSPIQFMKEYLEAVLECDDWYTPDWWDGEEYYIQMVVEKIDLKTLFQPVCRQYHIPIATAKGWQSILQRATYSRRFKEAEEKGLKCVLLYCGDHDPDGLRISEFMRKNLRDIMYIRWIDGTEGYDPENLKIDRFGLNLDFIEENNLTWIDNLITGSGKNLASPFHPNYNLPYVQWYLEHIGERKCEANALVVRPRQARILCAEAIEGYLGSDALDRFAKKRENIKDEMNDFRDESGLRKAVEDALKLIEDED